MLQPLVDRVARLGLVVSDPAASERFFVEAFGAAVVDRHDGGEAFSLLVGCPGARSSHTILRLGDQEIVLVAFDPPGRPYPHGSTSSDLWFQHFAIIVSDIAAAYARLVATGAIAPITTGGPVTLPPSSGGVTAFKFRDRDGHPLELLAFPEGGAPEVWQRRCPDGAALGIDHSAIAVGDTAASVAFFEACFGLQQSMRSENVGPEQSRMDDVADARVTVTGLVPTQAPPHVELLGYHVGARRPISDETTAADIAASFFVLETRALDQIVEALTARRVTFMSPGVVALASGARAIAVLDPDGHRFIVEQR